MRFGRAVAALTDASIADAVYRGALQGLLGRAGPKRCPQCWIVRPLAKFIGGRRNRREVRRCASCRDRYRGWRTLTDAERLERVRSPRARGRARFTSRNAGSRPGREERRVLFVRSSKNRKTGPIPVSVTDEGSCPASCPLQGAGCYAAYGHAGARWRSASREGVTWAEFCAVVASLPPGTLWRHNEAGDLPGDGRPDGGLDHVALAALVVANRGRRGFTFTHRPLSSAADRLAVRRANAEGFIINLSADSLADADRLAALEVGPVAVVLPEGAPRAASRTPGGLKVVVCPAQTHDLTCLECRLCAAPGRKSVVAFLAHGQGRALVSEIVRTKRAS